MSFYDIVHRHQVWRNCGLRVRRMNVDECIFETQRLSHPVEPRSEEEIADRRQPQKWDSNNSGRVVDCELGPPDSNPAIPPQGEERLRQLRDVFSNSTSCGREFGCDKNQISRFHSGTLLYLVVELKFGLSPEHGHVTPRYLI